ncbi:hypothetical protein F5Y16DRAFT_372855 [Xylariaceae sp. FL0255]|nr:hypothetical protein F5Y16DRAFT_372855 [Xylariaceae sp. FL0255]
MASKAKRKPSTPGNRKKGSKPGQTDQTTENQNLGADLPSLYPTYDGSYGRNTLMSLDLKKGQSSEAGIANEKTDDEKWESLIQGKLGKKYGMDSDLKKAVGEGHEQVMNDQHGPPHPDLPDSPTTSDFIPTTQPSVPRHNPLSPPFLEVPNDERKAPYTPATLPTLDPHPVIGVDNPKAPPQEHIPFYGMPQGKGSALPFSPARPESARSFNLESGLFSNAQVQTPAQPARPVRPTPLTQQQTTQSGQGQNQSQQQSQAQGQQQAQGRHRPPRPKPAQAQSQKPGVQKTAPPNNPPQPPRPNPVPPRPNPSTSKPKAQRRPPLAKRDDPYTQCNLIAMALAMSAIALVVLTCLFGAAAPALESLKHTVGTVSGTIPIFSESSSPLAVPTKMDYEKLAKEMRKDMPDSIWVHKGKNGKLQISQDFWHALRDLIKEDDMILILENAKSESPKISNEHWKAVKARIEKSGLLSSGKESTSGSGLSEKAVEDIVESGPWGEWLKQNEKALKTAVKGVALTKDEFLELFNQETSVHQREIQQELASMRDQMKQLSKLIPDLKNNIGATSGMSKHEVKALVDDLVLKAVNSAKLGAVANGRIQGHEADILANHVNFFGIGSGAVIDPTHSSPTWQPPKPRFKSKAWIEKDGYKPQPRISALSPWVEEGECFCAGPDRKGYGQGTNNISVLISRNIIPSHLVVEHILPGATLDAGAMPKDIELWAYIEEKNLRQQVEAFSKKEFSETPKETLLNEGYVKIGQWRFDNSPIGPQVHGNRRTEVFPVKDELTRMNATTNHVVVRALNNYGADHTCFYRLGLYGEVVERSEDQPFNPTGMGRWW